MNINRNQADDIVEAAKTELRKMPMKHDATVMQSPCPEWCADHAKAAEADSEWFLAARWWLAASACTLGHSRAQRYDDAHEAATKKANELATV